ncbi:MAG TPA: hypothetical protein VEU62_10160 [Bryobacterales bacterium]|nr:hypothetical protein [Bryobacterales bacterium]
MYQKRGWDREQIINSNGINGLSGCFGSTIGGFQLAALELEGALANLGDGGFLEAGPPVLS